MPTEKATKRKSKKAAKRSTSKAKASKTKASKGTTEKPREVDPSKLTFAEAKKRVAAIYKLEKALERAISVETAARKAHNAATKKRKAADAKLAKEIHDQRFGAGPLFPPGQDGSAPETIKPEANDS